MYLTEHDDPSRIKANIHMDMVGGAPVTKAVFRISGGPYSVPSFISDLGHEIGHFVNDQTKRYADGEDVAFPLNAPEGGKEPQLALMEGLDMGSDHDVFFEGTWRIPGLYLHDWPDRYIHTNYDLAANIDPTKLKRAAFIGAVSAWYLANLSSENVPDVMSLLKRNALQRSATLAERRLALPAIDAAAATRTHFALERRKVHSIEPFAELAESDHESAVAFLDKLEALMVVPEPGIFIERDSSVYERNPEIQGPMHAFGYSYLEDKLGQDEMAKLALPRHSTRYGGGGMFAYEALNLVDGKRTVSDIRDWLVAELGEVSLQDVAEYLQALESIGVIQR
jgi:aminopeptidase YwaD